MSSEQLADGVNPLDAELAATWDVLKGYSGRDTDLGIARRFGGAAAAYSLRDVGAMNGRVVKARRDVEGDGTDKEEDFSANQVSSGALEDWVNGKLESTLPADVDTASAAYSLRQVKEGYGVPMDNYPGVNLPSEFGVTLEYDGTDFSIKETGSDFLANYIGSTVFISPSGDDSSGDGSSGNPYKTLDKAITVASDNDKISLASGTYAMPTSDVNKSVAIVCPSGTAYIGTFNNLSSATIDTIDTNTYDVYNVDDIDAGETFRGYIRTDGTLVSGVRGSAISTTSDISQDYASKGIMAVRAGATSANFVTGTSETLQSLVSAGSILAWTDGSTDKFKVSTGKNVYVGSNIILASYATNVVETTGTSEIVLDGCEVYGGSNSTVDHKGSGRLLMFDTIISGANGDNIDYGSTAIGIESNITSSWCNRGPSDNTSTAHIDAKVLRVGGTYRGGSRTVHDVNDVDIYVFSCTIGDALGNDKIYLRIGGTSSPEDATLNYGNVTFLNTYNISGITELSVDADAVAFNRITNPETEVLDSIVRIRRDSDGVEVNVDFDSDRRVSANSSISTVSGSTTATDLNGFLNETLTVGVAVEGGASASDRPDSFTNATNSSFTATVTDVAGGYFPYETAIGDVITVSFDLELSGGASPSACTSTSINTVTPASSSVVYSTSGSYTSSFTCTADGTHFRFADGDDGTFTVTNFRIVSHTHSAFVHTWYDQAGSNDATQLTAANQPKIAESGALLADGLDFDGTDDYLEADGVSSIYTGTDEAHSSFVVVNSDAASTTQYILGIGSSTAGNPLRNTLFHSGGNIGWQVRDDAGTLKSDLTANPYVANQTYLVSALNSGTTIDFNTNSVINDNGTDTDVGASTINTVHIGTRANSPTGYLNGSIQELVFYATDQSDNRFKIESNINNYYGLYNDANEVTGDFIAVEGSGNSFTPNGTDGFILDIVTSTGYAGIQLNEKVTSGDNIFISFNADINRESTPASFNLALRKTSVNGSIASSQQFTPTQGFNSYTLTSNDSDAEYIAFGEGSDNVGIEVTDFKVSRVARNGFVETWYDQSANLRDAIQGTATNQPSIVQNGGIVKVNSKPAIKFDGNDNFLEVDGSGSAVAYSFSPSGDFGMFIVSRQSNGNVIDSRDAGGDGIFLQQSSSNVTRFRYNGDGSIDIVATNDAQHFNTMTLDGTTLSASVDGGTAGTDTVTAGVSTTQNLVLFAGFNNANFADGEMQEAIFYENNKTTDKANIEADIDNFYSIT